MKRLTKRLVRFVPFPIFNSFLIFVPLLEFSGVVSFCLGECPSVHPAYLASPVHLASPAQLARLYQHPVISFDVLSDIHCRAGVDDRGRPYEDYRAEGLFGNALDDLQHSNPIAAALVLLGDFTVTGLQGDYDSVHEVLHHHAHPENTLFSIGNHEFYAAFRNSQGLLRKRVNSSQLSNKEAIDRFLMNTNLPNVYYDQWVHGYHFIILGSEKFHSDTGKGLDDAYLSTRQLAWLQLRLKEGPESQPIFVFLHQPIPHTVAPTG